MQNYHTDWNTPDAQFSELVGKTFSRFDINDAKDRIEILCTDGSVYVHLPLAGLLREVSASRASLGDVA
jgi:hypothetical protein